MAVSTVQRVEWCKSADGQNWPFLLSNKEEDTLDGIDSGLISMASDF